MGLRSSHGLGRDSNGPLRVEVLPADELPKPNAEDMDARLEERKRVGRPFKKGNKAAVGRRPKLARLGVDRDKLSHKDPRYVKALYMAESYRKRRVSEMRIAHGFVSVGAMSIMATAALQLAMSRFMMDVATDTMDMDLIKKSSAMANDSRQNELAAWELCSREASAKTRAAANATPWLAHEAPKVRVKEKEDPKHTLAWEEETEQDAIKSGEL